MWKDAVEYLTKTRPELKERLFEVPEGYVAKGDGVKWLSLDGSSAEKVIGMKEYIGWEKILDDTVDDILKREKELAADKA